MSEIKKIKEEYILKLEKVLDQNKLNEIKTELFGKNGIISNQFKQLGLSLIHISEPTRPY